MHPRENRRDGYHLTAILSVVLVGWVIYSGTLDVPFLFDDEPQITSNAAIRLTELDGESLLRAAFESPSPHRPVANLSFALNYYFGKYDVRGYHRVNLLIHIASGLFVYFLTFVTVTQPVVRATLPVIDQKKSAGQNQLVDGNLCSPDLHRASGANPIGHLPGATDVQLGHSVVPGRFVVLRAWTAKPFRTAAVVVVERGTDSLDSGAGV